MFVWPFIVTNFFIIKPTRYTNFTIYSGIKLYMFQTVPLSIIRSLFTVHSAMVYIIQVCRKLLSRTRSCSKAVYKPVWHIPLLSVQWINSWWWTEELFKHVEFHARINCEISASIWFYYKEKYIHTFLYLVKDAVTRRCLISTA